MSITLEEKEHILRLIPLGVDIYTACIQAHLTLDQIDELEDDEGFAAEVDYAIKREERRLLELYSSTVEKAAKYKYDHKGLRDRLELLNPGRFSKAALNAQAEGAKDDGKLSNVHFYIPDNGRDNLDH